MNNPVKVIGVTPADENNQVLALEGGAGTYRKTPCPGCPWVKENIGSFPAEAFRISAHTSYDRAMNKFGCHESGKEKPATCAGFLLRNSKNHLGVRISISRGNLDPSTLVEGERELFDSYKEMAIANGVSADDPRLALCRADKDGRN